MANSANAAMGVGTMMNSLAVRLQLAMAVPVWRKPPMENQIIAGDQLVSYWCESCMRWVDVHIDVDVARALHEQHAHHC